MVVGLWRRSQQLAFRRRRSNQEIQCEPARGRLVLSPRRDRLQPVVVDDVMYVLGRNGSALIALDATTGKEIWIHDGLTGIITRGINYWQSQDGKDRRLLFSINSYLQAIDARTGKSILSFGKNGLVDLREGLRRAEGTDRRVQSRTPGKVWKNLLIMGSAAGEAWIIAPRRYPRLRRRHGQARLAVSHRSGARRVRLRDVAERRLQVRRRREQLG